MLFKYLVLLYLPKTCTISTIPKTLSTQLLDKWTLRVCSVAAAHGPHIPRSSALRSPPPSRQTRPEPCSEEPPSFQPAHSVRPLRVQGPEECLAGTSFGAGRRLQDALKSAHLAPPLAVFASSLKRAQASNLCVQAAGRLLTKRAHYSSIRPELRRYLRPQQQSRNVRARCSLRQTCCPGPCSQVSEHPAAWVPLPRLHCVHVSQSFLWLASLLPQRTPPSPSPAATLSRPLHREAFRGRRATCSPVLLCRAQFCCSTPAPSCGRALCWRRCEPRAAVCVRFCISLHCRVKLAQSFLIPLQSLPVSPVLLILIPRDPSIQIIPTLGPKVCKYYLHWAIWIPIHPP